MDFGSSSLNNVRFNLHGYTDSGDDLLGNIPNETPIATDIVGFLSYNSISREGDMSGVHERDRSSMWKLIAQPDIATAGLVMTLLNNNAGLAGLVRITWQLDPLTRAWTQLPTPIQYKIDFATQSLAVTIEVIMALSQFGVS